MCINYYFGTDGKLQLLYEDTNFDSKYMLKWVYVLRRE